MSLRDGSNYGHISGNQHHTGAIPKVVAPKLGNSVHPRAVNAAPTDTGNMPRPTINKPKPKKFKKQGKSFKKCMLCLGRSHKTEECRSKKFCNVCQNRSHNSANCYQNGGNNIVAKGGSSSSQ